MDCKTVDEECSSGPNSCRACDGEKDERARSRVKSLSMSRLPDRVSDFYDGASTLPAKMSSVQQFNQNLSDGVSVNNWYDPEESFSCEEYSSEEEDSDENLEQIIPDYDDCGEDQDLFPKQENIHHHRQLPSDLAGDNASVSKQIMDLSLMNTETKTFVRSSALDILAAFPKPVTVLSADRTSRRARTPRVTGDKARLSSIKDVDNKNMNGAFEDICENEECVGSPLDNTEPCSVTHQPIPVSNEHQQDASNHKKLEVPITSWSSTSDIGTGLKKKRRLRRGKKKAKYEISGYSGNQQFKEGQPDFQENTMVSKANSNASVPNLVNTKSNKVKKSNSSALRNFFRGKSESKEESSKVEKRKKEHKPVQKSKSFQNSESTQTAKNTQLNRMDSIRRLFKRPRDLNTRSANCVNSKPTENKVCLEISPPILKTELIHSDSLVDRDVLIAQRDRAYQVEKKKFGDDKQEPEVDKNYSGASEVMPNGNDSKDVGQVVTSTTNEEGQESPVPPVRWKHLQKKRLSKSVEEEGSNIVKDIDSTEEASEREETEAICGNDNREGNTEFNLNANGVDVVGPLKLDGESGLDETGIDDTDNKDYVIVNVVHEQCSNNSNIVYKSQLANGNESEADKAAVCVSPSSTNEQGGSDDDVFEDCVDNREIDSFPRTTVGEEEAGMPAVGVPVTAGRTSRKWASDVSSAISKDAIESAKKKKVTSSKSFSGVLGASKPPEPSGLSRSTMIEQTPPVSKRSMSIFGKMPSPKLEQVEPPTLVTDLVPTTFPTITTDRRSQIVLELFMTERTYVRGLETMIELFRKPLLFAKAEDKDVDLMFSNINDIFAVNKDLLFLLWEKVKHWGNEQCIGQIFVDMEERFKIYAIYCKNFDKSDAVFKQKIKRSKEFEKFLKTCYQDPLCQPGLDLPAYLITVVQRVPRYLLLLKDLSKKTPSSHPDYNNLKQALLRMNKLAEYINSQLQEVHGQKAMQELRSTVIGLKAYEVKGRTLLKEAEVSLVSPSKLYKCLLFNDIMVFAVLGSKDRSEVEMTLELRTLWFEDLKKQDPQTKKCDAIELYTPHRPYTMYACSRTDKRVWLQKLRNAIVNLLYGPDCEDPESMDISCRKASDTYIDGSVYCGEYLNGKRHGQGVMAWPNRTRYEGSWADDERHGDGQLTYYTGEKYVGNWVADKKDGEGRQSYVNGDVFYGQWCEGKMHGKGVIEFENGDCFDGDMKNNEVEGNGQMICISGLVYKGEWKKNKRHGQGHMFFPNGNEYQGEMLNDRMCGTGQMTYFNGDEYCGEWVNEMRHGIGNFKLVSGAVYDGQWNNDFMNGKGKMSYPNGDEYSGTWYQNKRVGKGQFMYAHGDTYSGQWQDHLMHGKGVMYYKDGSVYEGAWERGERHGYGKTVYGDKWVFEGEYRENSRCGRGKLIYSNNVSFVGEWKSDKFDGSGIFIDTNTEYSYQGDWVCDKRDGYGVEMSYKTRYEGNWKADMRHGTGIEKSHAGHTFEGTWKENGKHGKGLRTLRSGVKEEQHWHEGHLLEIAEIVAEDLPLLPRR